MEGGGATMPILLIARQPEDSFVYIGGGQVASLLFTHLLQEAFLDDSSSCCFLFSKISFIPIAYNV